jgi:hypothetical protein
MPRENEQLIWEREKIAVEKTNVLLEEREIWVSWTSLCGIQMLRKALLKARGQGRRQAG